MFSVKVLVVISSMIFGGFGCEAIAPINPEYIEPPAQPVSNQRDSDAPLFVFSYFLGDGIDGLHLATSIDGLYWKAMNGGRAIYSPKLGGEGLFRDPFIIRERSGSFLMVWTIGISTCGIGFSSSINLIDWGEAKILPVMEKTNAINCWAPEIFYDSDERDYLLLWSSTVPGLFPETDGQDISSSNYLGWNHRIWSARTADFESLTEENIFFDPGYNVIDATVFSSDDKVFLLFKDETGSPFVPKKVIKIASAKSLNAPFLDISEVTNQFTEGPSIINNEGIWFLYFDRYLEGQMGLLVSSDLKNWFDATSILIMPQGARHGTVLKITADESQILYRRMHE